MGLLAKTLIIHHSISYDPLPSLIHSSTEYLGISVTIKNKPAHIYVIYNSPNNLMDILLLSQLPSSDIPSFIAGDFNPKDPIWTAVRLNRSGQLLSNLLATDLSASSRSNVKKKSS